MTMLGIIIGIGSVIAIVTVGDSMTSSINAELKESGGENITVMVDSKDSYDYLNDSDEDYYYDYDSVSTPTEDDYMTLDEIEEFQEKFQDQIADISLSKDEGNQTLNNKVKSASTDIVGINTGYQTVEKLIVDAGRLLEQNDMTKARHYCIVSQTFVKSYFGNTKYEKAVSQTISIEIGGQIQDFLIVGVYHKQSSYYSDETKVLIPLNTVVKLTNSKASFSSFIIKPKDDADVTKLSKQVDAYWKSFYLQNTVADARIYNDAQYTKELNQTMDQVKLGIGAIAAISLLVGGIGVMNIMMVSVTERTREIGIRMALGAKQFEILLQFISEAILICLIGGVFGIILGVGIGIAVANAMNYPATPSISAVLVAVGFSMAIGVFFGYYPAKKASNLDPIESLRYE